MIILNKKRILFITASLFVSIFTFMFCANFLESSEYVETVSLPVSGKTVILDAGHGIPDERSCLLTLKITLIFYKR